MNDLTHFRGSSKEKKNFNLKKHKDNTLCSLKEVEKFLTCATNFKNFTYLFKLFK